MSEPSRTSSCWSTSCARTILSSTPPELDAVLGRVRELTVRCKAGVPDSFDAYQELAALLLRLTVMHPSGGVRLSRQQSDRPALGGWSGPTDPLPLNDGHFLRCSVSLHLADTKDGLRMKVLNSSYQYQFDRDGTEWVFRYDYLRKPPGLEPAAHLQLHGELVTGQRLERLRLPTGRVTLEAVIRLLADQFGIACSEPEELWRPALDLNESLFLEIAHQPGRVSEDD